jgi:hypothetical protein
VKKFVCRTPRLCALIVMACAALSLLGNGAAWARQGPGTITTAAFWELVQETQAVVRSLDGAEPEAIAASLEPLLGRWQSIQQVQLETGEIIPLDLQYWTVRLEAADPDLSWIASELDQITAEQDLRQLAKVADDLSALQQVLDRPEFQWQAEEPDPLQQWVNRLVQAFLNFLDRLAGSRGVELGSQIMRFALIAAGLAAVAAAAALGVRIFLRSMVAETSLSAGDHADADLTADLALERADLLSQAGDYRSAVRYLYLSTLLMLEEHGLLRYDRSKTNREYLSSISHQPHLSELLQEVVDVFDRVWYGFQPLEEQEYARYAERVAELRRSK